MAFLTFSWMLLATSGMGEPYSTTMVTSTATVPPLMSTRTPLVKLRVDLRVNISARPVEALAMLATPSTSCAARPAMVSTTPVAKDTLPSGFSSSLTSDG